MPFKVSCSDLLNGCCLGLWKYDVMPNIMLSLIMLRMVQEAPLEQCLISWGVALIQLWQQYGGTGHSYLFFTWWTLLNICAHRKAKWLVIYIFHIMPPPPPPPPPWWWEVESPWLFSVNYLSHDELAHSISNPSISRNRGNNNASYD